MLDQGDHLGLLPGWAVMPNDIDSMAWTALFGIALALYLIVFLYARFDRWAEHKSQSTPLAKTIPTLLLVALLYEIFPLDHFSILLPASAILIAVFADWTRHKAENNAENTELEEAGQSHD